MQKSVRILAALAVIGLAFWGWRVFFPSPEAAVRSRLTALAERASFGPSEGTVAKATSLFALMDYFTTNVEVRVEARGFGSHTFNGRDELMEYAKWLRTRYAAAKFEFIDMNITISPDKQAAQVNLTGKAALAGEKDPWLQELNIYLKREDRKWLIYKVETVRTLTGPSPTIRRPVARPA